MIAKIVLISSLIVLGSYYSLLIYYRLQKVRRKNTQPRGWRVFDR